jgi:hypothetical protein
VLAGNASVICGFWILCSVYWVNRQAEFTINYYTLNLIVSTLRQFFTGWPLEFFCAPNPNSLPLSFACFLPHLLFSSLHSRLAENYFELNCFILARTRTEIELPSFSPINAGVLHAGERCVVYCCAWCRGDHVTRPYCCAIQCLSRNLATHGAERTEGKGGEARRGSAPLLLRNRVPRGFCASTVTAWGDTPQCYHNSVTMQLCPINVY